MQDFRQAVLQSQLEDEQAVEFGQGGAEGLPSQRAQLVLGIDPAGVASIQRQ